LQPQPQPQSASAPYTQGYPGPAVHTPPVFPVQQLQTTPKPLVNPSFPNFYPTNPVAKPSVPQPFTSTVAPPRPFSPAAAVSGVSPPHGGFANTNHPNIPAAPVVTTQPGKFMVFFMCMC